MSQYKSIKYYYKITDIYTIHLHVCILFIEAGRGGKATSKLAVHSFMSLIHLQINNACFSESNQFLKNVPPGVRWSFILGAVALFFVSHRGDAVLFFTVSVAGL